MDLYKTKDGRKWVVRLAHPQTGETYAVAQEVVNGALFSTAILRWSELERIEKRAPKAAPKAPTYKDALRLALAELERFANAPATDQVQSHWDMDSETALRAVRAALA